MFEDERQPAVVLVAHDEHHIDVWLREGADWRVTTVRQSGAAALPSIDCRLELADVSRDPLAPPGSSGSRAAR